MIWREGTLGRRGLEAEFGDGVGLSLHRMSLLNNGLV